MNRNKKYSIIIFIFIVFIILSTITWDDIFNLNPKIGIIEINTTILESKKVIKDLNYFYNKNNIIAIVVRLNTPGGGVAASLDECHFFIR